MSAAALFVTLVGSAPLATAAAFGSFAAPRRGPLFASLAILCLANGFVARVTQSIGEFGLLGAVVSTFGISAIVWIGCYVAPSLLGRSQSRSSRSDLIVAAVVIAMCAIPLVQASWLAATGLGFYLILGPGRDDHLRRGGLALLALSGPMFWGRLILQLGGDTLLSWDAALVAMVTASQRVGNTVQMWGDAGYIFILPACSSIANVSLAILCCVLLVQWNGMKWGARETWTCVAACLAVIAVNVGRIGIMVIRPELYSVAHGPVGVEIANWLTLIFIAVVCYFGIVRGQKASLPVAGDPVVGDSRA